MKRCIVCGNIREPLRANYDDQGEYVCMRCGHMALIEEIRVATDTANTETRMVYKYGNDTVEEY